ncbi:hypothetical protein SOPP22_02150 [Shewanella sp. OPT22]|nr:hypothetical protein SOPP22_02150 [Shewanella sp. OPT22]
MKTLKYFCSAILMMLVVGCGSSYKASTQTAEGAFIQFSGNFWGTTVSVDNQTPVLISQDKIEAFEIDDKEVVRFPIETGTHSIKVSRDGTLIVNRKIYVSNSNVFEVKVP